MGELLARVAHQQRLVEAWNETRRRLDEAGLAADSVKRFEKVAAKRLAEISDGLLAGTWRPAPVHEAHLPKPDGGTRTLGIPVLEDRIVERAVLSVLDPVVDPLLMPWSFAYRKGLGVQDAIAALVEARDQDADRVVRADVADCFPSIERRRMLEALRGFVEDAELLELVRLLVYRPVRGAAGTEPKGLHQGSVLSPLLCNVYLDAFDREMANRGWRVFRYADDFAIPVVGREQAERALHDAGDALRRLGLELAPSKLSVHTFDDGVPFLGQVVSAISTPRSRLSARPLRTTVYVESEGGLLRLKGNRLRVVKGDETLLSVSMQQLRQIVLIGRTGLTTPVIAALLARGVDVVFLSERGRYLGRLQAALTANPMVRQAQYQAVMDPDKRVRLARNFVAGKIANQRVGVLRAARRLDARSLQDAIRDLERYRQSVGEQETLAALMGVEGSASRRYFSVFGSLLADGWEFPGRRRRPPPDPVNSMLSFGYTLLLHDAIAACESAGLDPYQGFLHETQVGRPSLALDLIEEFRPLIVDSVVIRAVNTGIVRREDFVINDESPKSCTFAQGRAARFLRAYERRMLTTVTYPLTKRRVSYRVALMNQALQLAEVLRSGDVSDYQPMLWK